MLVVRNSGRVRRGLGWARLLVTCAAGGMAVLLGAGGCRITTTSGDTDGGGIGPATSSPSTASGGTCNECLLPSCNAEWAVCAGDRECLALYQCLQQPGVASSATAYQDCYCAHPSGQSAYRALSYCDTHHECSTCAAACSPSTDTCNGAVTRFDLLCAGGTAAGDDAGTVPSAEEQAGDCSSCTSANCEAEKTACAISTNCDEYSQCVAIAASTSAATTCASELPDGKNASEALAACTRTHCAAACGL